MPTPPIPPQDSLCGGPLPELVIHGLELYNEGEYFEAHEVLETAWRAERGPVRELYRGILQAGVAYYHLLNGNYTGALKMISRCRPWLEPFGDSCRGINLARLREDVNTVEAELLRLGPDGISRFNRRLLKPVEYQKIIHE
jgi:uncharacterized protein